MKSEGRHPRSAFRLPRSEAFRVPTSAFRAVVVGGSAGGVEALTAILPALPGDFALPVLLVQHLHPSDDGALAGHLGRKCALPVIEPCDKERVERGHLYTAPANYHMLVERDGTISLSVDERVNWSRPSIDVLFESAARAWGKAVIAVILSGANADGAAGMRAINAAGGLTMAQDPETAETPVMPQAAIDTGVIDEIMSAEDIGGRLIELGSRNGDRGTWKTNLRTDSKKGNRNDR